MAYIQVPPDGAGKKVYSVQHSISGDTVQIQANHIASQTDPTHTVEVDSNGAIYTRYAEGSPILAPYDDLKVTNEQIVGVYDHTIDSYDDLFYVYEISGGTSTYENAYSSVLMSVTEDDGSQVKRITNRHHYYQPGTSMLIVLTVAMGDAGKTGNSKSWGYADDDIGVMFETYGTDLLVEIRGVPQGAYTNRIKVYQDDWNGDKLDGTGASGIVLDLTKAYQYYINISWPFGTVEFGIYSAEHGRVKCHESLNDGVFDFPYIKYVSLPIYFRNKNTANTGEGSDMRVISAVVKVEGDPGYTFWRFGDVGTGYFGGTGTTVTSDETPVLSIKPKVLLDSGVPNTINSFPETLSVYSSAAPIRIRMIWCGDDIFTGATWLCDSIDGPILGDIDATEIDTDADSYWNTETFYVNTNEAKDINLDRFFELNDEGVLLSGDGLTQNALSFTAQSLNGVSTIVNMDLSYKGLY